MKKAVLFVIFSVILMTFFAGGADAYSVHYTQTITTPESQTPITMKIWEKDEKMRIESVAGGMGFTTIYRKDGIYNIVPGQNMATKMPVPETTTNALKNHEKYLDEIKSLGAKQVGTENIDGVPCDIYEYNEPAAGSQIKVWVRQKERFPAKMTATVLNKTTEIRFTDIQINKDVPDELFTIPKGMKIIDISQQMQ